MTSQAKDITNNFPLKKNRETASYPQKEVLDRLKKTENKAARFSKEEKDFYKRYIDYVAKLKKDNPELSDEQIQMHIDDWNVRNPSPPIGKSESPLYGRYKVTPHAQAINPGAA